MDHDQEDGPLATPSDFLLVGIAMMILWPIIRRHDGYWSLQVDPQGAFPENWTFAKR